MSIQREAEQTRTAGQPVQPPVTAQPGNWRASVIAEYAATADAMPRQLRQRLAQRLLALTGQVVAERAIAVNTSGQRAIAVVDGLMFQLCGNELAVVRPCAHCGTGNFASAPITSRIRLGYALAAWEPYHPECAPADPPDDVSW